MPSAPCLPEVEVQLENLRSLLLSVPVYIQMLISFNNAWDLVHLLHLSSLSFSAFFFFFLMSAGSHAGLKSLVK